jgi:DNA polymerase (family X)
VPCWPRGRRPPAPPENTVTPWLNEEVAGLEINASPQRLDLPSDHIRAARDAGVVFAIDSDAHSVADQGNMPYGVGTAQRGWLTPDDVINTWPLDRLRAFLRKGR